MLSGHTSPVRASNSWRSCNPYFDPSLSSASRACRTLTPTTPSVSYQVAYSVFWEWSKASLAGLIVGGYFLGAAPTRGSRPTGRSRPRRPMNPDSAMRGAPSARELARRPAEQEASRDDDHPDDRQNDALDLGPELEERLFRRGEDVGDPSEDRQDADQDDKGGDKDRDQSRRS